MSEIGNDKRREAKPSYSSKENYLNPKKLFAKDVIKAVNEEGRFWPVMRAYFHTSLLGPFTEITVESALNPKCGSEIAEDLEELYEGLGRIALAFLEGKADSAGFDRDVQTCIDYATEKNLHKVIPVIKKYSEDIKEIRTGIGETKIIELAKKELREDVLNLGYFA